uniref:2-aminoethanethiol dioxygenase n=1 Tax=Knipowitschia caucasica TaxID=637954 RepID=A0AAV2JMD0_KNICA
MSSLVQRIARQALLTFRPPQWSSSSTAEEAGRLFQENQSLLHSLMSEVSAQDLRLTPRTAASSGRPSAFAPPVTYMHICETDHFSMGVFLLKSGAYIPLHDHPGMHGVLKVLYGKVRISCFDRLSEEPPGAPYTPPLSGLLRLSLLRSSGEYGPQSGPCVLSPEQDNLHQIQALDGPSAFMDILAPPYDPDHGRDCHYYTVLSEGQAAEPPGPQGPPGQQVWLQEVPQPADFWCGAEPYPGPPVFL